MPLTALRLALPVLLLTSPVMAAEQLAALRLQAEVAVESSCMTPPDGAQPPAIARLNASPAAKAAFCRCFAAAVAEDVGPDDPEDLIDRIGIPPRPLADRATARCLGESH